MFNLRIDKINRKSIVLPKNLKKFEINDRVKAITNINNRIAIGDTGRIVHMSTDSSTPYGVQSSAPYGVQWDKDIYGHDCDGHAILKRGWYVSEGTIIVIT